jgi:YbbR domain-containing protein
MKIINNIRHIFVVLGRKIDKNIIVPITKIAVTIKNMLSKDSRRFEKILSSKTSLLIITLVLSVGIFIAVDTKSIQLVETSAEVLYNQPVQVQYNEEAYVLQGVPQTVDITLIGRNYDLYLAKQIATHEVVLDLSGLKPGVHEVALKYKRALDTINYKLDPSVVTVTIYNKESEARTVDVDLLNTDSLDSKLVISNTELDRDEVIIKGDEETLKKVATVKSLVDVNDIVDPKVGQSQVANVPLVAYDKKGNTIDVEIVPSTVNANITIISPQKTVPVRFIPEGTMSFGKAINTISSNTPNITLYGDASALANITYIDAAFDVSGLKEDKEYNVTLKKPVGVRYMSQVVTNVKVTVGEETTKEFSGIKVDAKNLDGKYEAQAGSSSDQSVTVIVKGVASVLNNIDPANIKAYVDLSGYGVGNYDVDVEVERIDMRLTYVSKVKKVNVNIFNK